jgi:hypothetical protein
MPFQFMPISFSIAGGKVMQQQYYVSHGGQETGPYTAVEIQTKWNSKELFPHDYVYVEEQEDWIPVSEFLDGFAAEKIEPEQPLTSKMISVDGFEDEAYQTDASGLEAMMAKKTATQTQPPKIETHDVPPVVQIVKPEVKPAREMPTVKMVEPKFEEPTKPITTGELSLDHGEGKLKINSKKAETIKIRFIDADNAGLDVSEVNAIQVKAAPASTVVAGPMPSATVGEEVELTFKAQDPFGNVDTEYTGSFSVKCTGPAKGGGIVTFEAGVATTKIHNTVAGSTTIKFEDHSNSGLKMPQTSHIEFAAGAAKKLEVVQPESVIAGEDWEITVKAKDAYGNLATSFDGTVQVDISGSADTMATLKFEKGIGRATLNHQAQAA